jgi:tol-pal system protein YbgF
MKLRFGFSLLPMVAAASVAALPMLAQAQAVDAARLGVRISQLEEQLRQMQGGIEEANYRARTVEQKLKQIQDDTDFRLRELEQRASAAPVAPVPAAATPASPAATQIVDEKDDEDDTKVAPAAAKAATPNEQYNQAFRMLNQSKYNESYKAFKSFVNAHPKDPLVGNAYYWMGETHYVQRDYVQAADHFRQGFEAMPKGPKAADNLLKLAMSLSALNRNSESCIVLHQVSKEYASKSSAAVAKANGEMTRIGCK